MPTDPYDIVPYESRPLAITHPIRLATAALREGVRCAPANACRMLELGCADATNLLPLALSYPNSQFVGVDRSARQIAAARADVAELGITNLELLEADIQDLGGLGEFDYIVAHGVYSWVSEETRSAILRLFATSLDGPGVGYLSYNAQPGWGDRGAIRDLLRVHTRARQDPRDQITSARALICTLLSALGGGGVTRTSRLAEVLETLASRSDSYLLHEYLTEHNRAFAYSEVVSALGAHGLVVLTDLLPATTTFAAHSALQAQLEQAALPPAEVEAAIDLVTARQFRASLVCRGDRARSEIPDGAWLSTCEVALAAEFPSAGPQSPSGNARPIGTRPTRRAPADVGGDPASFAVTAAVAALADRWPGSLPVEELLARMGVRRDARESAERDLLRCCQQGYLELRSQAFPLVLVASDRPVASRLTRLDARRGRKVTNQLHRSITLTPELAAAAAALDGTRSSQAKRIQRSGTPEAASGLARAKANVAFFARAGLLVG